jgi:hypothetical protein
MASAEREEGINLAGSRGNGQIAPFHCARPAASGAESASRGAFSARDALKSSAFTAFFFFAGLGNFRERNVTRCGERSARSA